MWEDEDGVDEYTKVNDNFGDEFCCSYMRIDLGNVTNEIKEKDRIIPYANRDDPILIRTIEELGDEANGSGTSVKIIEIPDGLHWEIEMKHDDLMGFHEMLHIG